MRVSANAQQRWCRSMRTVTARGLACTWSVTPGCGALGGLASKAWPSEWHSARQFIHIIEIYRR